MWRGRNREGAVRQVSFSRLGFRPCRSNTAICLGDKTVCPVTESVLPLGLFPPAHASSFTHSFGLRDGVHGRQPPTNVCVIYEIKNLPRGVQNGPKLALGKVSGEGAVWKRPPFGWGSFSARLPS